MVTVHREAFVCPKADARTHPDHESAESVLRRHWWAISSMLTVRARLARRCPEVAAGRAPESLVIREGEFTVAHRPVSLRILLAACPLCPDDPPEKPMEPDGS